MDATTVIAESPAELARKCWEWLSSQIRNHQSTSQRPYALALAGGSTPRLLYELAGQRSGDSDLDWQRLILLLGDERNVAADHPDSNFRMVANSLLNKVSIPPQNVLTVAGAGGDPEKAARSYEKLLYQRLDKSRDGFPLIDCVLLGLGEDAHTASLFPNTQALGEQVKAVVANYVDKLNSWRITLTLPVINAASQVAFLVSGSSKNSALKIVWDGPRNGQLYPAQLVQPNSGKLFFFVDQAAIHERPTQSESAI